MTFLLRCQETGIPREVVDINTRGVTRTKPYDTFRVKSGQSMSLRRLEAHEHYVESWLEWTVTASKIDVGNLSMHVLNLG